MMVLMPVNWLKRAIAMAMSRAFRNAGSSRSPLSSEMAARMASISPAAACGPTICARKCSASCSRLFCISQRGLSGMKSSVRKKSTEGSAAAANIHLQFAGPAPVSRQLTL